MTAFPKLELSVLCTALKTRDIRQGWPEYDRWLQACYKRASTYNLHFSAPLDENEVSGIAKSIAKWTIKNFSEIEFNRYVKNTHTKEIQSVREKKRSHRRGVKARRWSTTRR